MSTPTPIAEICNETLRRLDPDLACPLSVLERIREFAETLDQTAPALAPLERIELENAATDYVINWFAAERLEVAVAGSRGLLTPADNKKPQRLHPALVQAAAARSRMRQIFSAIKAILKNAPEFGPVPESLAADRPAASAREINSAMDARDFETPARARTLTKARVSPDPCGAEIEDASTPFTAGHRDLVPAVEDSSQDSTAESPPSVVLPMNRAQRRAQARIDERARRRALRSLRKAK